MMGNVALEFKPAELALIQRTVAKDCNEDEFRLFVHLCRSVGLDPLRKQAYAFVFGKGNADTSKRQLTLVTSIQGYRTIAERTGNYRPDTGAPRYYSCEKGDLNPLGIERCEVTVFKFSHGEWFPVVGEAWWSEHVPLKEEWKKDADGNSYKTGKVFGIDPKKEQWTKMPRLMIAKIAEAQALRKAWPDDFSNVYSDEETHREAATFDAVEVIQQAAIEDRLERIGASARSLMIDWCDGKEIARVPIGQFMDKAMQFLEENEDAPMTVRAWTDRNQHELRNFWALQKGDALTLKKKTESLISKYANGEAIHVA